MAQISIEDLKNKADSLYRLVILAGRRAGQVNRAESRPLVSTRSKKSTLIALEEIVEGRVTYHTDDDDEDHFTQ